jgi:hypothetical protein
MPNNKLENMLLESIKNLLYKNEFNISEEKEPEHAHNTQFQWEDINRDFALEIKDSDFFDSLNSVFYNVHSYKWIDDPKFEDAMIDLLHSQGIPKEDIVLSIKALNKVREQYLGKDKEYEKDVGWHQNLKDIENTTKNKSDSEVSDTNKETFSGDNKPFHGVEPDNTRPIPIK